MPAKPFVRVAPKAKRAGIQPIDMCRLAERNEVHVNSLLGNVKELEHEKQIIPAIAADADQAAVCGQLLEFAEMA